MTSCRVSVDQRSTSNRPVYFVTIPHRSNGPRRFQGPRREGSSDAPIGPIRGAWDQGTTEDLTGTRSAPVSLRRGQMYRGCSRILIAARRTTRRRELKHMARTRQYTDRNSITLKGSPFKEPSPCAILKYTWELSRHHRPAMMTDSTPATK